MKCPVYVCVCVCVGNPWRSQQSVSYATSDIGCDLIAQNVGLFVTS